MVILQLKRAIVVQAMKNAEEMKSVNFFQPESGIVLVCSTKLLNKIETDIQGDTIL